MGLGSGEACTSRGVFSSINSQILLHTYSMQRWLAGGTGWGGGKDEQTQESVPSGSFLSIRNAGPEVRAERDLHEVVFLPFLQRDPGRGPTIWLGPAAPLVSPLLPDGPGLGGLRPGLRTRVTGISWPLGQHEGEAIYFFSEFGELGWCGAGIFQ